MKFTTPTPIQAKAIPVALSHRDLIGCAQTGTGKTAAFSIPIITRLMKQKEKTALILVPTRELAAQVCEVINQLLLFIPDLKVVSVIGGVSMQPQLRALAKKPRIIVATPGRLVDHLHRGSVSLSKVEILTLDEADRMLDMGFAPQLNEILRFLPKTRQTLFFSATLPANILKLAQKFLKDPIQVAAEVEQKAPVKISQKVVHVDAKLKNAMVLDELNAREGTVLIFARTQHRTDRLAKFLDGYGVSVARIHGGRTQGQRTRALDGFRKGAFRILVATDIAARGLDIDHVAHVINYDLPQVPEDYIHRIGRTGRAGRSGQALSLVAGEDKANWKEIEKLLARSSHSLKA